MKRHDTALLVCAALVREVGELIALRGWQADVYGVPAHHHLSPRRIAQAVDEKLGELTPSYERVVVVYGDCGTAGALDRAVRKHGARRLPGAQLRAAGGQRLPADRRAAPGNVLPDRVADPKLGGSRRQEPGLGRHTDLKGSYFRHFTGVVYLRRRASPALDAKAESDRTVSRAAARDPRHGIR